VSDNLPALIEEMNDRIGRHTAEFEAALPKGVTVAQLKQDALNSLRATPALATCHASSVLGGLMTCAQLGLRPGVAGLGHAWLLPMKNWKEKRTDATLIIGYRGYADLAYRHPRVVAVVSNIVRQGDVFAMDLGADLLTHKMPPLGTPRGSAIGFYAMANIQGPHGTQRILTEPMSLADMQAHRDKFAMAKNKDGIVGPWRDHFDEMGRKTMVRARLVKAIPTALDMAVALAVDEGVRTDFDPAANPVEVTTHPNEPNEDEAADPGQSVRESVTIRQTFPTGGLTGDQDREIARLVRDRKMSRDAVLDVVEKLFGERKSARQLTEEQAARLIKKLEDIPLPTMEGDVLSPGRPTPEPGSGTAPDPAARKPTPAMMNKVHALLAEQGITDDAAVRVEISRILGTKIESRKDVTFSQATQVIEHLEAPNAASGRPPAAPTTSGADHSGREHLVELIRTEWTKAGSTPQALGGAFRRAMNVDVRMAADNELNAFLQQLRAGKYQPVTAAARKRAALRDQITARFDQLDEHLSGEDRLRDMSKLFNRPVHRLQDLTAEEADTVLSVLGDCAGLVQNWDSAVNAAAWKRQPTA
jgi:recombination protein RecT